MTSCKRFSIWLKPCKEQLNKWQVIIDDLSQFCNSCSFMPHITIHAGQGSLEKISICLEEIAGKYQPVTLTPDQVKFDNIFSKSFYISFSKEDKINLIHHEINKKLSSDYEFLPHMSLAYTTISKQKRILLMSKLKMSAITFDTMVLVHTPNALQKPKDIELWNMVREYPLIK